MFSFNTKNAKYVDQVDKPPPKPRRNDVQVDSMEPDYVAIPSSPDTDIQEYDQVPELNLPGKYCVRNEFETRNTTQELTFFQ